MENTHLKRKAYEICRSALEMISRAGTRHIGRDLSQADILSTLFYGVLKHDPSNPAWPQRDRYVQSKGHYVETFFPILADMGYFPKKNLQS
jgi:transketolase